MHSPNLSNIELVSTEYCQVRARARTRTALFELRSYDWRNLREAALVPPSSYVELTTIRSKGRHNPAQAKQWRDLGHLRFLPADLEFESRWQDKQQHSICCAFDNDQTTKLDFRVNDDRLLNAYDMDNPQLFNLLKRTWQEIENPGLVSDVILESLSLAILETLCAELCAGKPSRNRRARGAKLSPEDVDRIIARIKESRCAPSLQQLADEAGVSMRHFSRLFHHSCGMSIHDIYQRERFQRATALLQNPALLIKEIAYLCGFNNSASFCKAFRASMGRTPQAYRNQHLGR